VLNWLDVERSQRDHPPLPHQAVRNAASRGSRFGGGTQGTDRGLDACRQQQLNLLLSSDDVFQET